jgi:hypothetical protein
MFKSKDERAEASEQRAAEKAPKALSNLRARRSMLITDLAAPRASSAVSLHDVAAELYFVERAIESLSA